MAADYLSPGTGGRKHGEENSNIACGDGHDAGRCQSGVALAKTFVGTENGEKIVGTKFGDHINGLGGDDVLLGYAGPDKIRGGDENDQQYGGRGNDIIYSEGGFRDLVNCGRGTDTAYVDSKDRVVDCERKR